MVVYACMCTSQRWPTIGASAQLCSALRPIVPFLKTIKFMDLSNHLRLKKTLKCTCYIKSYSDLQYWYLETHKNPFKTAWKEVFFLLTHAMISSSPVITLPMEQRFSVTVQGLHRICWIIALLHVIQCNKESGLLHSIQRLLVLAVSEVGITGTRPRHSKKDKYGQAFTQSRIVLILR